MENKNEFIMLHRIFAVLSFLVIFIMMAVTAQPSVPFWDCGEFLTAMTWQQVPHPPGSPLFLLLGRLFQIIIPFGDLGWRGNMLSVTMSAATIPLLYLIIVLVIKNFKKEKIDTLGDALAVYGSALIGALALGFSGTFWFNAVESETYNTALLGVTIVMYLMMRWTQVADEPGNERYIMLSLYIIGLSMGLHQPSLLVIFTMILIIYFRKYQATLKTFLGLTAIGLLSFYLIYDIIAISLPAWLAGRSAARDEAYEFAIQNSAGMKLFAIALIIAVSILFAWALKKGKNFVALTAFGWLVVLFSFTVYAHVLIRSNSNPPMDENDPQDFHVLASYLSREQYGSAPTWPRRYHKEDYYVRQYNKKDVNGNYIYGQWNPAGRKTITRKDGSQIWGDDWNNVNTAGELAYLWKYQTNHMYFRYFFWNFVGRKSDVQDAGVAWFDNRDNETLNYKSGYADNFPVKFYALPLLFGLIGLYYHFKRDPKMALVYLASFLVLGVLTALYQNQQEPQPRERDYFYVTSFLVWCLWIGMGVYAIIDTIAKKKNKSMAMSALVLAVSLVLVPVNMAVGGIKIYSRAGNYIPFDYAYNILQSVEQDAIVFTNGDNDTFSVWYLQDVAGVRRDVRICNLSLGNTLWYVTQLKNCQPWGAKKLPLTFSDESLQVDETDAKALSYDFGEAQNVTIPVKREVLERFTNDPTILDAGNMSFIFTGKPYRQTEQGKQIYMYAVSTKLVLDILKTTKFERPVYYSTSVGKDNFFGLEPYFRQEGLCYRICPVKQQPQSSEYAYNETVMDEILMNINNSNDYSKTQKYGLKLRNLNNSSVYFDDVHRQSMEIYRRIYIPYADYLVNKKDPDKAKKILSVMRANISDEQFPMQYDMEHRMAYIYEQIGDDASKEYYARMGIKSCEDIINKFSESNLDFTNRDFGIAVQTLQYEEFGRYYGPYHLATEMYKMVGDYAAARSTLEKLSAKVSVIKSQFQASGATNTEDFQRIVYNETNLKVNIMSLGIDELEKKGDLNAALDAARAVQASMEADTTNPMLRYFMPTISTRIKELEVKLGISKPQDDTVKDIVVLPQ